MRLTGRGIWGEPTDRAQCLRVLRRAIELGVDLIDTADSYGPYVSEDLIREALHPYPEGLVIATKAGLVRTGPEPVASGGPARVPAPRGRDEPPAAGRRTDRPLPAPPDRPSGPGRGTVRSARRPGPGGQGAPGRLVQRDRRGHRGGSEGGAESQPCKTATTSPTAARKTSWPTARARESASFPGIPSRQANWPDPAAQLEQVTQETGATPSQVALAWLLAHSPVMLPIPGTASVSHLEENTRAAGLTLTADQVEALTAATRPGATPG